MFDTGGHQAGFSLLELMVVTAIMAALSVGAVLATTGARTGPADMARFQTTFDTQRALAIAGRDRRGLRIDVKGVQLMLWRNEEWVTPGTTQRWRDRSVFASLGFQPVGTPNMIFEPNGSTNVFSMTFSNGAECVGDGWTGASCSTN